MEFIMKSDFVRRPGHSGSKPSTSRSAPASTESVKKKEEAGEFSPMNYTYKPDKPIIRECRNPDCQRVTYMYYSTYGESYTGHGHVLECGICGTVQEEE
jgi:hypothetical protein